MNVIKIAVLIGIFAILIASPVLAEDSTSTAIAQRKINIAQKMGELEQRRLGEASKAAMFRQKLEDRKLKIASHEAEIKAKIQKFKDKQKAEIAIRVNTNLNKINQNQTDQMLRNLDLMTSLLDKLTNRVTQGTPDIKDLSAANQAIADARTAIDTARSVVQTQAQKDYTIAVTTETRIRLDAKAKRDQLHTDIKAVRQLVIDAKQAVSNAIRVAKSGKVATPSANIKEGTTSGQQ